MGKKDNNKIKRIMAVLLCAFVFISFAPNPSFAIEGESAEATESTETIEESVADDGAEELTDDALTPADPEAAVPADSIDDPDSLLEDYMDVKLREELSSSPSAKKNLLRKSAASKRRERLNDNEKIIYDNLKTMIDSVAAGNASRAATSFSGADIFSPYLTTRDGYPGYYVITSESLGISEAVYVKKLVNDQLVWTLSDEAKEKLYDLNDLINALMADEPYALYWYDKTSGLTLGADEMLINSSGDTSDLYFPKSARFTISSNFTVAEAYRAAGSDEYAVDTAKTGATQQAVANAADIISANDEASDYDKLNAYKTEICTLTSYNSAAAHDSSFAYGDPWQMIYVFDGDTSTNVVCEGYSKAFQYLCDHTYFAYDTECDTVTGTMAGGTGAGLHMWNILHMDDGRNYIADITNSDTSTIGSRGGLFISPAMAGGSVDGGFKYDVNSDSRSDITYIYDSDTRVIFSDSELEMSELGYNEPPVLEDITYTWADDLSSCTASGTWNTTGEIHTETVESTTSVKKAPSCFEDGITTYKATFEERQFRIQTREVTDIPAYGEHAWDGGVITKHASEGVTGVTTHTCARCGAVRTEVIPAIVYPQDLPVVKIVKPKAGKKKATIKWKKVSKKNHKKIQGIEIQVATDPGFTNIVKTATGSKKKTSKVVKGLNAKTKYYVRIRAYKNAADGKHVSAWKTKKVKIK